MTSNSTKIQAASTGGTTTDQPAVREHGLSVLRSNEAKSLISLAQDALDQTYHVGHALHSAIYGFEPYTGERDSTEADTDQMLCEALTCLETADHYLRMLGSVLDERKAQNGDNAGSDAAR